VKIAAINDPNMDLEYLRYQLKYDSAHGRFPGTIEEWDKGIIINGHKIRVHNQKNPEQIHWGESGASIVVESTGVFL